MRVFADRRFTIIGEDLSVYGAKLEIPVFE